MNKRELVDSVAVGANISKADAGRAVDATLGAIESALVDGDRVQISGFGTFEVRHRGARTGRNPQTGAAVAIAATNAPSFKASKTLKEAVNR